MSRKALSNKGLQRLDHTQYHLVELGGGHKIGHSQSGAQIVPGSVAVSEHYILALRSFAKLVYVDLEYAGRVWRVSCLTSPRKETTRNPNKGADTSLKGENGRGR